MRVPLSWLRDYVSIEAPAEDLAHRLTMAGVEVEAIETIGAGWDNVYVGEVIEVRPHPNADRLTIAVVDYGRGSPLAVVTGASNIKVGTKGQKVPTALVGARLLDGHSPDHPLVTLKPATIRGIRSEGMICSELELGISEVHEGIMILDQDAPVGRPLREYLGDTVLHITPTPNQVRCLSVIGVAREVAALTGQKLRLPEVNLVARGGQIDGMVKVEILDPDLCPRYSASLITDLVPAPSPSWLERRLRAAGMRPINSVVDVTNYVMLEWGQPLHAFDYHKIRGGRIIVRRAGKDADFTTLDGEKRTLTPEMLVIADGEGIVAVAGVMGGLASEVAEDTRAVLLESANFERTSIRRTSRTLGLLTEASTRFDKGLDPEATVPALVRATELIRGLASGVVAEGMADVYPQPPERKVIEFPLKEIERLMGLSLPKDRVIHTLRALEFGVDDLGKRTLRVRVPSHRGDISLPADLVEEVSRIEGYELIPTTMMSGDLPSQRRNWGLIWGRRAKEILAAAGLFEAMTYSVVSSKDLELIPPWREVSSSPLRLANPLVPQQDLMRTTLLPSLLRTLSSDLRYQSWVRIFEMARVYLPRKGDLPEEVMTLAMALAGTEPKAMWSGGRALDFYDLKGTVEAVLRGLGIEHFQLVSQSPHPSFHSGRVVQLLVEGREVGILGELHSEVARQFDLEDQRVYIAELDFDALAAHATLERRYQPLPRYPGVVRDLALIVGEEVPAERVAETIKKAGGELLVEVTLFDLYRGAPIPAGKKSLAYSLTYRAVDRTLTDEEAARVEEFILKSLKESLGAQLRE